MNVLGELERVVIETLQQLFKSMLGSLRDLLPIIAVISFFQLVVLDQPMPNIGQLLAGVALVVTGLTFFIHGLEQGLFPIGEAMAHALARKGSVFWLVAFAFALGFGTTIAEPSLMAVAIKANEVSGGAIGVWGLRIAVALGVAVGISLGCYRIVVGDPIHWYICGGYAIVVLQTMRAPKLIIPLAYGSGGVTTSTVTVPLVAALGLGLSESVPGRNPLIDGFGLIAFTKSCLNRLFRLSLNSMFATAHACLIVSGFRKHPLSLMDRYWVLSPIPN